MSIYNDLLNSTKAQFSETYNDLYNNARASINEAYSNALKDGAAAIKAPINDTIDVAKANLRRKGRDLKRWLSAKALRHIPFNHPDNDQIYAIKDSENSSNSVPQYSGYGIEKDSEKSPDFKGYDNAIALTDSSPSYDTQVPDNSLASFAKWGLGGGALGATAAALYTNFEDEHFARMHPVQRRRRLVRNLALGTGGGALLALATKYLIGK